MSIDIVNSVLYNGQWYSATISIQYAVCNTHYVIYRIMYDVITADTITSCIRYVCR